MRRRTGGVRPLLALLLTLALVLAACGGDAAEDTFEEIADHSGAAFSGGDGSAEGSTETTEAAADMDAPEEGGDDGADEATVRADLGDGAVTPAIQAVDFGRDIIYVAELDVAVSDVAAATEEATRIIQGLGGIVFGQRTTGNPEPRSVLTFKLPPEDFQTALDRLGGIGELRNQTVTADDVTERIVDLESRINTAQASTERLRELLSEADSVEVIAQLENQLLERETQLETLRGQLRTLSDQVALATIVLTISEAQIRPQLALDVTAYPGHDGTGLSCPGESGLSVEEGSEATLCFEVTNVGDTDLSQLSLEDPILDVDLADLIVVRGDPSGVLEPGESVTLAYEVTPEADVRTQTTIAAIPLDGDGEPLVDRQVAATSAFFLNAIDPGGVPSFREGLEESWELLVTLGQVGLLALGWLLPFIWLPLALWGLIRVLRRRDAVPTVTVTRHAEPEEAVEEPEERQPEPV